MDPSERTVALYQEIRSGRLIGHRQAIANGDVRTSQEAPPTLEEALHHLQQLQTTAVEAEHRLQEAIHTVEAAMNGHKRSFYLLTCAKIDAGETLERRWRDGTMLYWGQAIDEVWRYRFYTAAFSEHPHYFCFVINNLILCPIPSPNIRVGRAIVYHVILISPKKGSRTDTTDHGRYNSCSTVFGSLPVNYWCRKWSLF
jgi:hypothetical protein